MVEEYQHWLHIKLMDSLPNLYSIYFPSGTPSVSFPLPLFNFFNSLFHSHSAFFCPCFPSNSLSSSLISCPLSLAAIYPPLQNLTLVLPLSLFISCLFFPHLIQCGLAHREVFDLQNILVGFQLVEDVSHPSWSNWYVVLHHGGVVVLCIGKECTS